MKITLATLAGIAITFVLMSLTTPETTDIPRYHIVAYGNGLAYDAVTGKAVGMDGGMYKDLKNGDKSIKDLLDAAQ